MFKTPKLGLISQAFNNPTVRQAYCKNRSHKNRSLLSFSAEAAQIDDYTVVISFKPALACFVNFLFIHILRHNRNAYIIKV